MGKCLHLSPHFCDFFTTELIACRPGFVSMRSVAVASFKTEYYWQE